jgi:RNA polymerase sigma-70 factor (ECF subfamily)
VTVDENDFLAKKFEDNRARLRAVAYRMLGTLSEADDAVQEAWLRLSRTDPAAIENLGAWLTAVVARVSLDMLRSRKSRHEEVLDAEALEPPASGHDATDPEQETLLADSVGLALLVVLETLPPAERLAFVLHDMFALPFEEIAPIVGRSPTAARQLASRARRRMQGDPAIPDAALARQREVADAYLAAVRGGDFNALLAVLDPEVVLRADAYAGGGPRELRGAQAVATGAVAAARGARFARTALVNGSAGIVVAPRGHLTLVLVFRYREGTIAEIDVIGDPARLGQVEIGVFDGPGAGEGPQA